MSPTQYEQIPPGVGSMERVDGSSSESDEPFINTPSGAENGTRLSISQGPSDDQPDQENNNAGGRGKFQKFVKRKWESTKQLLDDKPYEVKDSWGNFFWHLSKRLLTTFVLLSAIVFGATGTSFTVTTRTVWKNFQLDQDVQLAAFGILNTILAHMGRDTLAHISDTLVTKRMVSENGRGATVLDFEMKEELSKPWTAVSTFCSRRKQNGWTIRNILRLALSFLTGTCLLLQGAGMNTVGMPKRRWWPDTRFENPDPGDDRFFFQNKTMRVSNVSRMSVWGRSWNMIREGGEISWDLAHTFAAISSFQSLENLYETVANDAGWYEIGDNDGLIHTVLNVTNASTPSIQAVAINGKATAEMWDEQRQSGKAWARRAVGWFATLKLTGLLLDTACIEAPGHAVGSWEASSVNNGTILLTIGPTSQTDDTFPGATCTITITQNLIAIQQWIVDEAIDRARPGWSIDNWGSWPLPGGAADTAGVAHELADWFNAVSPSLQHLVATPGGGGSGSGSPDFTAIARRLSGAIVGLGRGHAPTDGLAMVVAVLFSGFLTPFEWGFEEVERREGMAATTAQGPVRWEVYGSGPRLRWQWAIAAVLAVNLLVQCFDVFLLVFYRQAKGLWLGLGGMLVAANAAGRMASMTGGQGAGFVGEEGKGVRYFVRQVGRVGRDGDARATLVSEYDLDADGGDSKYTALDREKLYGLQEK